MNVDILKTLTAEALSASKDVARDAAEKLMPKIWEQAEETAKRGENFISVNCEDSKPGGVQTFEFMCKLADLAKAAGFQCRRSEYWQEVLELFW